MSSHWEIHNYSQKYRLMTEMDSWALPDKAIKELFDDYIKLRDTLAEKIKDTKFNFWASLENQAEFDYENWYRNLEDD